jgi:hypothetical protein
MRHHGMLLSKMPRNVVPHFPLLAAHTRVVSERLLMKKMIELSFTGVLIFICLDQNVHQNGIKICRQFPTNIRSQVRKKCYD